MTDPDLYRAIRISGDDAANFLQGQLTQDVRRLRDAITLPAAWCNPKGRVISTARIIGGDSTIDLVLPSSMIDLVLPRLAIYRLRAKVDMLTLGSAWMACAFAEQQDLHALQKLQLRPGNTLNACCRAHGLVSISLGPNGCVEVYGDRDNFERIAPGSSSALSAAAWRAARVDAGLADIDLQSSEKYTPHMLNLDATGAVSFDKGCYTGQEVVARTENLGKSKRRLMRYNAVAGSVTVGSTVSDGERDIGTVVNVGDSKLLAVTPVALHGQSLFVEGQQINPLGLPYDI